MSTTVSLTATPSVAEGGQVTYTATLTNAAVTPLTVTLSTGQTIGIAAGATTGTVSIAAPTDDPYLDAGSVARTIASTSGGGFESLSIDGAAATTTVSDTIDTTTATLTATPAVAEGGTITYTVSLTAPVTGSAVNVLLANGQTVTIPVGASSASVTSIAPDNVYGGGASVANNIVSASGGNYEQLTPNTAPVTTSVSDDGDVTTVSLSATASVVEGTSIIYTAALTNAAQTAVTVTLSNGATIAIAAGATTGSVIVAAPGDDPYLDASTVSATIATATGGNFESLQIDPAAANTTVTDDSDPTTLNLSATASVAEGGSIVYTATLTNAAQTPLTVTLSSGQTITIAAGQTTGSVSIAAPTEDVYLDAGSVSRGITATSGGNFENLLIGTASATTSVTDTIDATTVSITGSSTVAEGATASYTVSLTSPAQTAVTVNLTYSGTAADGSDYTGVASVTIAAGASSASFNIATLQDVIGEGAENFTVTIASASGGNFESLVISGANGAQTTTITDDDTPTLAVSSPTVGEGGFAVFTVSLSNPSAGAVTFNPTLSSGTATVGTDTATSLEYFNGTAWVAVPVGGVTIAAGSMSVQLRVATNDDVAAEGDETFSLTATVTAGTTGNASAVGTATITDDVDATTLALTATPGVAEGGTIVYTATLSNAAVTPLTVTLSTGQTIAIAAGATAGSVSILAPTEDPYVDASTVSRTIASTSGGGFEALTVNPAAATTSVTDTIDTTTLSISGSTVVTEGSPGTYTVSLTSPAQTAVTVNLTYAGTAANGADYTGVATVTIAAGASSATFNIATIDDLIDEVAAESFTVTLASATGGNFENLVVSGTNNSVTTSITDNDNAPTIAVSSQSVAEAGGFAVFTVSLTNPSSTATTVSLALADGTATSADYGPALEVSTDGGTTWIAASSATFAAGATSVLVRTPITGDVLDEADETFTLTATRTAGTTSNTSAVGTTTITDDDATPSLVIDDVTVNETAGTATFTVTLSAASGQTVSVNVATSNGTATAGADYTAVPSTTLTFAPGVITQTVTVTILDDGTYEGAENFNVLLSGAVNATIADPSGLGTINDNDLPALSVSSPTVGEGGFAVFTVALSNPSTTAVTFNPALASGTATVGTDTGTTLEYFNGTAWVAVPVGGVTIAAGSTSAQVRVATTDDFAAEGNETFTLTATRTAGSTSNASAVGTATISDDSDVTTVSLTATPSVVEGGNITYTATLTNAAVTPLTVTLSSGQTISIAAGATTGTVSIAAPGDDPYIDAGTVSRTIATTSGGGLEALTIDTTAAVTNVTDDSDATTVTLTATPSVAEGGTIIYTATLTNAAQTAVTVTLSTGQTIGIAAGATSGTVSIAAPGEDPYIDAGSVSRTITSASGGNFESLVVNPAAATTSVTDTIDVTTATLTATPSVAEGGTITYTVSLTAAVTGSAVTVTLAGGQTITIPVGSSAGTATTTAPDNAYARRRLGGQQHRQHRRRQLRTTDAEHRRRDDDGDRRRRCHHRHADGDGQRRRRQQHHLHGDVDQRCANHRHGDAVHRTDDHDRRRCDHRHDQHRRARRRPVHRRRHRLAHDQHRHRRQLRVAGDQPGRSQHQRHRRQRRDDADADGHAERRRRRQHHLHGDADERRADRRHRHAVQRRNDHDRCRRNHRHGVGRRTERRCVHRRRQRLAHDQHSHRRQLRTADRQPGCGGDQRHRRQRCHDRHADGHAERRRGQHHHLHRHADQRRTDGSHGHAVHRADDHHRCGRHQRHGQHRRAERRPLHRRQHRLAHDHERHRRQLRIADGQPCRRDDVDHRRQRSDHGHADGHAERRRGRHHRLYRHADQRGADRRHGHAVQRADDRHRRRCDHRHGVDPGADRRRVCRCRHRLAHDHERHRRRLRSRSPSTRLRRRPASPTRSTRRRCRSAARPSSPKARPAPTRCR